MWARSFPYPMERTAPPPRRRKHPTSSNWMYCPSCGRELPSGAAHCPGCSVRISAGAAPAPAQDGTTRLQSGGGPGPVKGLAALLGGALALACGLSASGLLVVGACLLYCFAQGAAMAVPWFLAEALPIAAVDGGALMFSGVTVLLAAVLLAIAAGTLMQGLTFLLRKSA